MRSCLVCGEDWPLLTTHVCPTEPKQPEHLCALLWDCLTDLDVPLGGLNIASQVAQVIAMPLAKELTRRERELVTAMEDDCE